MSRNPLPILLPLVAVFILLAAACSSSDQATQPAPTSPPTQNMPAADAQTEPAAEPSQMVQVVTTSNIVADWVAAVGQDRVEVLSLMPPGADPHTYQPGAQDISHVADADLIMSVGVGLESGWLNDLVQNAAQDAHDIVELGESIDPIDFVEIFEEPAHEEMSELVGRLLIGDGDTGAVSVIELDHGEVEQDAYDLGSRAGRIYATKSGRFAVAVASDANLAQVFDGGIYQEAHDDHFDLVHREMSPVGLDLAGDRPVHLYIGKEWATIFYDGSGDVLLINEHELEEEGAAYTPVKLNAGPHHGAAVPFEGDLFAITAQHPDFDSDPEQYRLPTTVDIRDLSGEVLYSAGDCPSLHGDAGNGHVAVFGCRGGVLTVSAEAGQFDHTFIPAPVGEPEDFRLTSVWGAPGSEHFFALGSAVGLYVVEPEAGSMEQLVPVAGDLVPIQVALSSDGEQLVVVLSDGEIRLYDAHDGAVIATNAEALTTPVETGFWARPHVAMGPDAIFVTDSVGNQVLHLDAHDLEVVNHWDVAGTPVKIAFVGLPGETGGHHEDEHDGHGHEAEAEAGHDGHGHEAEAEAGHDGHDHEAEAEAGHDGHDHDAHAGHDHGELDPHFWFDPLRVKQAVDSIAAHLSELDPDGQAHYRENAAAYNRELDELHAWIQTEVDQLPPTQRQLVTTHDAFQYFAQRYGFEVVGTVLPLSTEVDPSAQEIAALVESIQDSGTKAVFAEKSQSDRLLRQVADDTGAQVIGGLYTGTLGEPGGEAGTYQDFMRYNVTTIVTGLK